MKPRHLACGYISESHREVMETCHSMFYSPTPAKDKALFEARKVII